MATARSRDRDLVRQKREQLDTAIARGELSVPEAVKRMREISGLTQEQFAKHRGMSLLTLKKIESGKGNPTLDTLEKIGRIFGYRIGFIAKRDESTSE
ncbi:helix-turn-helix domain-containing protein [Pseudoxanthomonas kaohsiungensis]|uniref:Helix-turn-helix domain-containing protein n=1 Tax=Pseudoxanthomonas kaohsiungensis TaxID=283923 RepID=A0ABW3LZZ6_9GAMM|nr:helix-turn-helix transcriptional regulator [Pseudoxanthomonas kaohsiungensis]KAF1702862.1 transcriptional regulator [Pseudoxanthomonas kaohsiungensis]